MQLLPTLLALTSIASAATAQDWAQYHGPLGNRHAAGRITVRAFEDDAPKLDWTVPTKNGFSSFVVHSGRTFTLESDGDDECIVARDATTGKDLWRERLGTAKYDGGGNAGTSDNDGGDGPRSTPSCDGERVYAFDARLVLHCFEASSGKLVFRHDLDEEFGGRNIRWQNAASPLVEGDLVFVAGGGPGASLIAFDKKTGEVRWKKHDELITHATPIAATIHGERQVIFYVQKGLVAVDPKTGDVRWRVSYPFRVSSAASPVVDGNLVYVSAGYGVGAATLEILRDGEGGPFETKLLWRKPNKLMNHWSTPVAKDGFLYGMFSFKKYGKGPVCCVDLRTGETKWQEDGFGPGNCILVGDDLLALSDKGELVVIAATPEEYREVTRKDVLRGKCWSTPAWSDGSVYVRSTVEGAKITLGPATER
ncbi:MAG: PQQ-like beta-propeller repeat protein [Planctomycetes bacterium]|nr:PQQ-like beta-propeller repeat protein [Planctomycetota bacterium]